jgi:hypothetical protein
MEIDENQADNSTPFTKMADRIKLNINDNFGGGFVIVDPSGDIKELLLLNNTKDLAMFWSTVRTIADMSIAEAEQASRGSGSAFGRR